MAWRVQASKQASKQARRLTVVAEAVDEDKTSFGRALGLASVDMGSAWARCRGTSSRTFHVFVYSFLPSSTVCQPSTTDMFGFQRAPDQRTLGEGYWIAGSKAGRPR